MSSFFFRLLTVAVGCLLSLNLAMSGYVGASLDSVRPGMSALSAANAFFWTIGAATAWAAYLVVGAGSPLAYLVAAPKAHLAAGIIGASVVFAVSFLVPTRVGGAGAGFTCLVVGQVLMGLLLAHFGALGTAVDPLSIKKAGGLLLLLAGAWMTQK